MAKAEKVYEFEGSQNLNTTPIDITGLQGDTYDYELILFFEDEGLSSTLGISFNNDDSSSNYRDYVLQGNGSTANASTGESNNVMFISMNTFTYPVMAICRISGESGDERSMRSISSLSGSASNTRVRLNDFYWKNTADEITSIQLEKFASVTSNLHIILYRVPKTTSQANWEKVGVLNWSSESTEKSFTGLDGDQDKKYRLIWHGDQEFNIELNNDSGSNYTRQYLRNNGGTIQSANSSESSIVTDGIAADLLINAESGVDRLIGLGSSSTSAVQQNKRAIWWQNTADNITSIDCTPSASATGTAILYRPKYSGKTDGSLNWELVDRYEVSGNFSAGQTTSLSGDDWKLIRIEFIGDGANELRIRFNADAGSNYVRQYLRGLSGTASASGATQTYMNLVSGADASDAKHGEIILYPKSGTIRPSLGDKAADEDEIRFDAQWWTNTADEITAILTYASDTDSVTGTIKIWGLK